MNAVQVVLVVVATSVAAEARYPLNALPEDAVQNALLQGVGQQVFPFAPEVLDTTKADDEADADIAPSPPLPRHRRSTTVFRPLFATRERDAQRLERRHEHELRPAARPAQPVYPAGYSAGYSAGYYAGYSAGHPAGR